MAEMARRPALAGRFASSPIATVAPAPTASRLSLRAPQASRGALAKALGVAFADRPNSSFVSGKRAALWLGPDEWLLLDESGVDMAALCRPVAALHSAVDISHRNVGIVITGIGAEAVISAGCPRNLDLDAFPTGACARTLLGKVEIVLWRKAPDAFRVEVWRSFSDYAFAYLEAAARDTGLI